MTTIAGQILPLLLLAVQALGAEPQIPARVASLNNEATRAMARGVEWLARNQNAEGYWSTKDHPAVTALALVALQSQGNPAALARDRIVKGYDFLAGCVKEDGSVHNGQGLVNYNTSLALLAFAASKDNRFADAIVRGRKFLIGSQIDQGEKGVVDTPFDGGVGYGGKYDHSDMGNTLQALEALYYTKGLAGDGAPDLNWKAAIQFLQNCQNLTAFNQQSWASDDPQNKGGFVYYPGHSMAGEMNLPGGRVALRSYGSISYGGLLSYIYAELPKDDPRVAAVFDWLRKNYTLEENPGMGPQGLYYYFHTMAKALDAHGIDQLPTNGGVVKWREQLALRLINLQRADGSWENDNGRWWEKDPALVTSYAVITLRILSREL
jgi:squalene-hopene/tetraprenyl-beta-curcumene cyclase